MIYFEKKVFTVTKDYAIKTQKTLNKVDTRKAKNHGICLFVFNEKLITRKSNTQETLYST